MAVGKMERWKKRLQKKFFSLMARPFAPPPPPLMAWPLREELTASLIMRKKTGIGPSCLFFILYMETTRGAEAQQLIRGFR